MELHRPATCWAPEHESILAGSQPCARLARRRMSSVHKIGLTERLVAAQTRRLPIRTQKQIEAPACSKCTIFDGPPIVAMLQRSIANRQPARLAVPMSVFD